MTDASERFFERITADFTPEQKQQVREVGERLRCLLDDFEDRGFDNDSILKGLLAVFRRLHFELTGDALTDEDVIQWILHISEGRASS